MTCEEVSVNRRWRVFFLIPLLGWAALAGWALPDSATPSASDPKPTADPWRQAEPGYKWEFPRDHASHPEYKTEWWYVTGHLFPEDSDQPEAEALAFQMTFFRVGLVPDGHPLPSSGWAAGDLVMAHASLADPTQGTHRFSEVLRRATPLLGGFGGPADTTLAWCQAPAGTAGQWKMEKIGEGFRLRAADDRLGFGYDLTCTPLRPPVFHGEDGFSPKSASGKAGSLYFSFTRMEVRGVVSIGDREIRVRGQSWLDREIFSNSLAPDQIGWDWVSLQLDDGRDLMLYRLRGQVSASDFALGTLVRNDGTTRNLPAHEWSLQPLDRWTSPETGSDYPVRWRLIIPAEDIDLELKAVMPNQENLSTRSGIHYWEGAVTAQPAGPGDSKGVKGRGFVELTGYGEGSRPPV
jgi:predicted secreted hydrolase